MNTEYIQTPDFLRDLCVLPLPFLDQANKFPATASLLPSKRATIISLIDFQGDPQCASPYSA